MNHKFFSTKTAAIGERQIRFILSNAGVDRDNDTVDPAGWDLTNYKRNPIVLFAHNYSQLPVAKAVQIGVANNALSALVEFPPVGLYDFADSVYSMVKGGFLNGTSVGFKPIESQFNHARNGTDFLKQELLEFSIVPIPSNPAALVTQRAPAYPAALKSWLATPQKETHTMKHVPVLFLKDDSVDEEDSELDSNGNPIPLDGKSDCNLFALNGIHCPNVTQSLDCPRGSECPSKRHADPDAPGPKGSSRYTNHKMKERASRLVEQSKLAELLRWERGKRVNNKLLSRQPVVMQRRPELEAYLGDDCLWPEGDAIVSLGID